MHGIYDTSEMTANEKFNKSQEIFAERYREELAAVDGSWRQRMVAMDKFTKLREKVKRKAGR